MQNKKLVRENLVANHAFLKMYRDFAMCANSSFFRICFFFTIIYKFFDSFFSKV